MCGFAYFKVLDGNFDLSLLKDQSLKILAKRGPDDQNYFILKEGRELFCHARLEIIGNSMDGKQPAITDSSKSIMLFNGAIYNYKKIADKKQHTRILFIRCS